MPVAFHMHMCTHVHGGQLPIYSDWREWVEKYHCLLNSHLLTFWPFSGYSHSCTSESKIHFFNLHSWVLLILKSVCLCSSGLCARMISLSHWQHHLSFFHFSNQVSTKWWFTSSTTSGLTVGISWAKTQTDSKRAIQAVRDLLRITDCFRFVPNCACNFSILNVHMMWFSEVDSFA